MATNAQKLAAQRRRRAKMTPAQLKAVKARKAKRLRGAQQVRRSKMTPAQLKAVKARKAKRIAARADPRRPVPRGLVSKRKATTRTRRPPSIPATHWRGRESSSGVTRRR
jgi:hypothetical protein